VLRVGGTSGAVTASIEIIPGEPNQRAVTIGNAGIGNAGGGTTVRGGAPHGDCLAALLGVDFKYVIDCQYLRLLKHNIGCANIDCANHLLLVHAVLLR
jgi:hypothetical protein